VAEVLVDGSQYTLIRRRETVEELVNGEILPLGMVPGHGH
jgi:hypothetical protein